ncbi:SIR2 family protein [Variovorax sp. Sphag1AA]|uniref:SIR2 family protein n=1 Tax=Variovorax sp. Sphag1AA TaxID=2587027 RepID=UPI001622BFDB|nr:SIR2 family protein [Variovorax sp. Sphag1AA]MBB3177175.1 hypothetical protein [Variovorax sp. Sphag1AA]
MNFLRRLEHFFSRPRSQIPPLDRLQSILPRSAGSLALLAGAGISVDAPSNLLAGWHFMDAILSRVMPAEVDSEMTRSLISVPRNQHFRPGEFIRFETLMMELSSGLDPQLHVLDCLDECEHPNANHYVIAELIRRHAVVMTTNFDRLIEVAYHRSMKPGDAPLRVVHLDDGFALDHAPGPGTPPTLWKLHGSLSVDGRSTRESVQATLEQVMWPSMRRNKRDFLRSVIESRDMVLVGYSGSDDLDLVPVLAESKGERAMAWIDHAPNGADTRFEDAHEVVKRQKALTEYELVGRDRVFFVRWSGQTEEQRERTALVRASTADVLQLMGQRYCPGLAVPSDAAAYEFGASHPDAVRRYFDHWFEQCAPRPAARCGFAINLLTNRRVRPGFREARAQLQERHRSLVSGEAATPEERLDGLMESFNTRIHDGAGASDSWTADRTLFDELQKLVPQLQPRAQGGAHRLSACALWNHQEHRGEAEERFRLAWEVDRSIGHLRGELATLTTWQRAAGSLRDHLSEKDHHDHNAFARMMGDPIFPDDAFYRLRALSQETGYQFNLWEHLLATFDIGYVEEDPARRQLVRVEARNMVRAAVDMGDIVGEMKSRLLLAASLQESGDLDEAAQHLVCLIELEKAFDLDGFGDFGLRARAMLAQVDHGDFARRVRPALAASMWVV